MPNTTYEKRSRIGRIDVRPSAPRPGETVRVEVFDSADQPLDGSATAVTINGIPGALQYLQFPTEGARRLAVRVIAGGESERRVVTVDVQGAPLTFPWSDQHADIALIGVTQSAAHPYEAQLTLGSFYDTRAPAVLSIERGAPEHGSATPSAAIPARQDLPHVDPGAVLAAGGEAAQQHRFEWDFGDGSTAVTSSPTVTHDYFASIDHAGGIGQFVVTCHIAHAGITVRRTLTIGSAYTLCKRTGTVVPHVQSDIFAHKRYDRHTGSFRVHNVEDTAIVLDRVSITPVSDAGDAVALPAPFAALGKPITIAPRSSSLIGVNVPFVEGTPRRGELQHDVKGFVVLYAGTCGDYPVRCSATFDVPVAEWDTKPYLPFPAQPPRKRDPWPWDRVEDIIKRITSPDLIPDDPAARPGGVVLDRATGTVAVRLGGLRDARSGVPARARALRVLDAVYAPVDEQATKAGDVALPRSLHTSGLLRLAARNTAAAGSNGLAASVIGNPLHARSGKPEPGPVAEGQTCDPDNLTEEELAQAEAGQLVCQLTDELLEVMMPARWMNARKGDVILSPGGGDIISGLLLHVHPPQWYSHVGIMTRNYDEITHSTGNQKRLMDHPSGIVDGTEGLAARVLKYMWPGAVTQTVQHAVHGEYFPDPEHPDRSYLVRAFGPHMVGITHNDQMVMIPPIVLKPDPMHETPEVRSALHAIASDARNAGGRPGVTSKYHYRFYCYTDPAIGNGAPEGDDAGWAAGTRPAVCSSFIWLMAKGRNASLESSQAHVMPTDLEPNDIEQGASVQPGTFDGLYLYSARERRDAADWLFDTLHNQAFDQSGWLGELLTDAADDVANQVLNAFANDNAEGRHSSEWENPGNANAVSPDNMLWWDGPARGGLYGYAEPALYREPRVETYRVSRWKKVLSRGTIRGRVFADGGAPVAGAIVQVYDSKSTPSGSDGSFTLADVPLGTYALTAWKVIDGVLQSAQVNVTLAAAELVRDIHLQPPADRYRIAQVFIDFWGRDHETFGADEIHVAGPEYFELELGPDRLINSVRREYRWGREIRVEYDITVRLLVNNTIDVAVQGTLYEGTDEENRDLDGQGGVSFQVPVGQTAGETLLILNTDEATADAGLLSISVKNVRNNA